MDEHIYKLARLFEEFPGIGKKQAKRFVYFLIRKENNYVQQLLNEIAHLKQKTQQCPLCLRYFERKNENRICEDCRSANGKILMIIEKDSDYETIKKSNLFEGKYFLLGNMEENKDKENRYEKLWKRIQYGIQHDQLKEILFALPIQPEYEHERIILTSLIKKKFPKLRISMLGRGLSSGLEIEYSDEETLKFAITQKINL